MSGSEWEQRPQSGERDQVADEPDPGDARRDAERDVLGRVGDTEGSGRPGGEGGGGASGDESFDLDAVRSGRLERPDENDGNA
jgi:hypothetical protein